MRTTHGERGFERLECLGIHAHALAIRGPRATQAQRRSVHDVIDDPPRWLFFSRNAVNGFPECFDIAVQQMLNARHQNGSHERGVPPLCFSCHVLLISMLLNTAANTTVYVQPKRAVRVRLQP
jgi:hypothetical protein